MLFFDKLFKDYSEFVKLFGTPEIKKHRIELSYIKWRYSYGRKRLTHIPSQRDMYVIIKREINKAYYINSIYYLYGTDIFPGAKFGLDVRNGITEDPEPNMVRYIDSNGRQTKVRIGKFINRVVEDAIPSLPAKVKTWFCEEVSSRFTAKNPHSESYELNVDDDFESIYNSDNMDGDFHSCMTDKDYYSFYNVSVDASAASLWHDGKIVARCVIYNEVHVRYSDKVYRLAERQYSRNQDHILMQKLVDMLIEGGHIDGYKRIGAGYSDTHAWILNDGSELKSDLWINCEIDPDINVVSYQDTFKYYDHDNGTAHNSYRDGAEINLDVTCGCVDFDREYDEVNRCYVREVTTVHIWNDEFQEYDEMNTNVRCLDEYYCIDDEYYDRVEIDRWGEYIPIDEAVYCEYNEEYYSKDDCTWCSIMDEYIPDEIYDEVLEDWKERNWEWDDINEGYVEDTVEVFVYDEEKDLWVSKNTIMDESEFVLIQGELFEKKNLMYYHNNDEVYETA